jgi:hypothetical protein
LEIFIRQCRGLSVESYEPYHARYLQHANPLGWRKVNEHVAGEQRNFHLDSAIFPLMHGGAKRQEVFNLPLLEGLGHTLLVLRTDVGRVPMGIWDFRR